MNNPHLMYYAPDVSNEDVGGTKPKVGGAYPPVILHGPHGYMVQHLGEAEAAVITEEYRDMRSRLCKIKQVWCWPTANTH